MTSPYRDLAKKWDDIANKMEGKDGVTTMTANTHRLFANELKTVCASQAAAGLSWGDHMIPGDPASVQAVLWMLKNPK